VQVKKSALMLSILNQDSILVLLDAVVDIAVVDGAVVVLIGGGHLQLSLGFRNGANLWKCSIRKSFS
jgi:hypothetical protein